MQMVQKMLATRGGTVAVGGFAAAFGALLLLMYLANYRNSVDESGEPITVLVAKSLIEKGTPGDIVGIKGLFQTTDAPHDQLQDGAITDPSALRGRLATNDIYPGEQLTTGDFSASASGAIGTEIAGNQRAISVPVDNAHGMVGQVKSGDRVDVLAGFNVTQGGGGAGRPVIKVLSQNVLVLEAPSARESGRRQHRRERRPEDDLPRVGPDRLGRGQRQDLDRPPPSRRCSCQAGTTHYA